VLRHGDQRSYPGLTEYATTATQSLYSYVSDSTSRRPRFPRYWPSTSGLFVAPRSRTPTQN
jgi:hypothetical protein